MPAPSKRAIALAVAKVETSLAELKALVGLVEPGRLPLKQAAHALGVSERTVKRRAAKVERIEARAGDRWSIAEADLPKLGVRPRKSA